MKDWHLPQVMVRGNTQHIQVEGHVSEAMLTFSPNFYSEGEDW